MINIVKHHVTPCWWANKKYQR